MRSSFSFGKRKTGPPKPRRLVVEDEKEGEQSPEIKIKCFDFSRFAPPSPPKHEAGNEMEETKEKKRNSIPRRESPMKMEGRKVTLVLEGLPEIPQETPEESESISEGVEVEYVMDLSETKTMDIFFLPKQIATKKNPEYQEKIRKQNKDYQQRAMNLRGCGTESYTQTFTPHTRDVKTQKSQPETKDVGCQLYQYNFTQNETKSEKRKINSTRKSPFLLMEKLLLQKTSLHERQKNLRSVNTWNPASSTSKEKAEDVDSDDIGKLQKTESGVKSDCNSLEKLWIHTCAEIENKQINAILINQLNNDLIVVAYGSTKFGDMKDTNGFICFWTLKNPSYPERIIKTPQSCTCLDFNVEKPHLLAAGFYDGSVKIFDIRKSTDSPLWCGSSADSHRAPVWKIQWLAKNQKKQQKNGKKEPASFFSIGGDGLVKHWPLCSVEKRNLNAVTVLKIKRCHNQAKLKGSGSEDTLLNGEAVGTALMISPEDPSMYYIATEEGLIHKCSISYNEQAIKNYFGHFRAVYSLEVSPINSNFFLSASEDWSLGLWHVENEKPLAKLNVGDSAVKDCAWCPFNASIVACCLHNGTIQVWDLLKNRKDPLISLVEPDVHWTTIAFSPNTCALFAGSLDGRFFVYQLKFVSYHFDLYLNDDLRFSEALKLEELANSLQKGNVNTQMSDARKSTKI